MYERQYLSPRPPPKISLRHDLNWNKGNDQSGSTVEHQPDGKLVQQSLGETLQFGSSKPTQFYKPIEDRTVQPVTQEIVGKLQEEPSSSDRAGQLAKECFQHFKYGIEIRIQSVNQDDSHSWVRISYGTVKYVNDSIEDDTENLADPQEEESVPTSSGLVVARSKAEAKPQPRESTGTTTIPLSERVWIDIEPSKQDLESYNLSKKIINLFLDTIRNYIESKMEQFNSTK